MRSPINNISSVRSGVAPTVMIVGVSIAAIVGFSSIFVVPAGEVGVVTTLGKVSKNPRLPGLNLKIPFVQSVHFFNIRTQVRPENFSSLTKDLQVIEATATIKYAVKQSEAPRIYSTIATGNAEIYERIIQPSLLKALKSVFSKYELVTIATDWNNISQIVETNASAELAKFDYVEVKGLDLTGLKIAEEYRSAIEQKQIAEQQLLKAQTEVKIAGQEAIKFETLNRGLNDRVLYKLFLDKWDGKTQVVPGLNGRMPPVIVGQ
ncbi:FtsH protease regulator HflC [Prochlorococcus sp. MIT 1306]|nr:prohibitin family protein [Prochlorococcus sp. MIT 1306]KZR64904.1 FtsH protease regulator HflC [Prochlorococcus sp. MIT 1306]